MKHTLIMAVGLLLAGCGATQGPVSSLIDMLLPNETAVGQAAQFAQRYEDGAQLMQIGFDENDRNSYIILDVVRDGSESWLTPEGGAVYFDRGVLRGTRGFGDDMMASDVSASTRAILSGQAGTVNRFHSFLDGSDQTIIRSYVCEVSSRGGREIQIGEAMVATRLMEENCSSLNQEFMNLYWVRLSDGKIVQSRQWAGDFTGRVQLRIVP